MSSRVGMARSAKVYVAGHRGLLGSALVRGLRAAGFENLVTRAHAELDLADAGAVRDFFARGRPEYVFLADGLAPEHPAVACPSPHGPYTHPKPGRGQYERAFPTLLPVRNTQPPAGPSAATIPVAKTH